MARVLIIDDDQMMRKTLSKVVNNMGHEAVCADNLNGGLKALSINPYDVVFLDVHLPDGDGLRALPKFREARCSPEVVIITGLADVDGAELAIKSGAWDYIQKSSSVQDLRLSLRRALQYREEKKDKQAQMVLKRGNIIGESKRILECLELVAQAATSEANVLVTGETGTGKELFARAVHDNSPSSIKGFVLVDCAALPESLVESALFGYKKGAFTGADKDQDGMIKLADGGTLFLDEVGELSPNLQKAFLRVTQERWFRPIGSRQEVKSNFRLLAATNRDLNHLAKIGKFRKDLLYRLQAITIKLPPLRERSEDIKELAIFYTTKRCESYGIGTKGFSTDFLDTLTAYDWPGNIRELVNAIEVALAGARYEPTLFPKHLPDHIRIKVKSVSLDHAMSADVVSKGITQASGRLPRFNNYLDEIKHMYFRDLILQSRGNIQEACLISGLSRSGLYKHLKIYKISASG